MKLTNVNSFKYNYLNKIDCEIHSIKYDLQFTIKFDINFYFSF